MKDSNKFTFKSVNYFMQTMKNFSFTNKCIDQYLYCPITERLLFLILNEEAMVEGSGSARLSSSELANKLGQTKNLIHRRLKFMAKYSLITCYSQWSVDQKGLKQTQHIKVNPKVKYVLSAGAKAGVSKQCVEELFKRSQERDQAEADLQGFHLDIRFGDKEPKRVEDIRMKDSPQTYEEFNQSESEAGDKILEAIAKQDKAAAKRAKENKFWREKSAKYIECAAHLWKQAQIKHGFGSALPNWQGDTKSMPQQAKSERNELISTFKQYGGKTAALSWYIYCAGKPQIDPKTGRMAFDPTAPHRQYITADRKPSQYTKHFNSIIADPLFKQHATDKWPEIYKTLHNFFGDLLDVLPRDSMTETTKTGISFGDTGPSLSEVAK